MLKPALIVALAVLVPTLPLAAAEPAEKPGVAVITAFHEALADGARQTALDLLAADVLIFESGGAELSRDEYAGHHLGADMEYSAAVERQIVDQVAHHEGDVAWVLTRSTSRGTFRGRPIDAKGVETMILRHGDAGWRITHIHWSSR